MAVECLQCFLKVSRNFKWIEFCAFAPSFLRHVFADVLPEITEHGHVLARNVFGHRDTGEFNHPTLNGVHEGKVAQGPREDSALCVSGAAQKERCSREIDDTGQAKFAIDGFETGNP